MTILKKYFEYSSNVLEAMYKNSSLFKHKPTKGLIREGFISNFLEKTFPRKFVISSGEVIDFKDTISGQADIIIYDESTPIVDYGGLNHFLSDGVLAHIEVKSDLQKSDLEDGLKIIDSIKKLNRGQNKIMFYNDKKNPFVNDDFLKFIPSYIFAYEGMKLKTCEEHLKGYYKDTDISQQLDGICVLNKYTVLKNCVNDKKYLNCCDSGNDSLFYFFLSLYYNIRFGLITMPDLLSYDKY